MSKGCALALVLVFLTASCVMVAKPVSGASVVGNSWVEKAPMHVARGALGVGVVNGKIFAIGGCTAQVLNSAYISNGSTGVVAINEEYDPATDTWTMRTPMPTPRAYFATAVYQNKIYCIGGISQLIPDGILTAVNEVYDPTTDKWETKTPMPIATADLQANVVNGKIYLIGGYPNGTLNQVYDPATDSWASKAPVPSSTIIGGALYPNGFAAVYSSTVFNDKIYEIGAIMEIYDPANNSWSSTALPTDTIPGRPAAVSTSGILAPERIYIFSAFASDSGYTKSNKNYDPQNNTWVGGVVMPTFRLDYSVVAVNDMLYVIGGYDRVWPNPFFDQLFNDTPSAVNEQYTPVGYGTPDPSYVLETTPPKISLLSPLNQTYNESSISLIFTADKQINWASYSLDGQQNVTITGNSTIANLTNGLHNITVYANDTFGNIGASQTITFTVKKSEPFPTVTVAAASTAAVAVACAGILLYLRKKHKN